MFLKIKSKVKSKKKKSWWVGGNKRDTRGD
jgi:hypothetical protein